MYIFFDIKVIGIIRMIIKLSSVGIMMIKFDVLIIIIIGNFFDINFFLMVIGGVIVLFLGVIMV